DDHHDLLLGHPKEHTEESLVLAAALVMAHRKAESAPGKDPTDPDPWSPFAKPEHWRLNAVCAETLTLALNGRVHELQVTTQPRGYRIATAGRSHRVEADLFDDRLDIVIDGHRRQLFGQIHGQDIILFDGGKTLRCTVHRETYAGDDLATEGSLEAPMNGAVIAVQAHKGDRVTAGQTLVIMEAMKMEHAIKAPADGIVSQVFYAEGDQVAEGAELIAIDVTDDVTETET
ncbi:MAG TPA: biotin/lipoyl-containing protein, partial [Desulfurivibrionaceae bacterium]|nr:biotin/lipoyl-containing protein [Desulfurivibrionaceae bacterium]